MYYFTETFGPFQTAIINPTGTVKSTASTHMNFSHGSSHINPQPLNDYYQDMLIGTYMLPPSPTRVPVTVFEHLKIPTRANKKVNTKKYIYDFFKRPSNVNEIARLTSGCVTQAALNQNQNDTIKSKKKERKNSQTHTNIESSLSSLENYELCPQYTEQNIGYFQYQSQHQYITPPYRQYTPHNRPVAYIETIYNPTNYNNFETLRNYHCIANYVQSSPAPVNSSMRNYPEFFHPQQQQNHNHHHHHQHYQHHVNYKTEESSSKCSTMRQKGDSKTRAKSRTKSKSIERVLDENSVSVRSKSTKSSKKSTPVTTTLKVTEASFKSEKGESAVAEKKREKDAVEKSAFKKLTYLLNGTARKSRLSKEMKTANNYNETLTSDNSTNNSSINLSHSSIRVNASGTCSTPSIKFKDNGNKKTADSIKTEKVCVVGIPPPVTTPASCQSAVPPPPAPPIDINILKPVSCSNNFLTLKNSSKMRIPIPDKEITKTFDVVLDELKTKLARIQTSENKYATSGEDDINHFERLLHKPVLITLNNSDVLMPEIARIRANNKDLVNLKTNAKNIFNEMVSKERFILGHVERGNGSCSSSNNLDYKMENLNNGGGGGLAVERSSSSVNSNGKEELKEYIVITKSDSSFISDGKASQNAFGDRQQAMRTGEADEHLQQQHNYASSKLGGYI